MPSYRDPITSKLPDVGTTIFSVMSGLAHEQGAINLSQGYPDFETSRELIDMVSQAMVKGYNQYAPMPGIFTLREAISNKIAGSYGTWYDPDLEMTITAGATQAIFTAISALVHPGDEVIIFAPSYDSYGPTIEINGGKVVEIEMKAPEYSINWEEVSSAINARTRMIVINSPHNPTGTLLDDSDMRQLQNIVRNSSIVILSDEVYEHMVYDGGQHQSIARFEELAQRSFLVGSFGKTFHNTGWKVGYCAGPKELMAEFRKIHQFNVFSVNHPIQRALKNFLENPENYQMLSAFFQEKRDLFLEALQGSRFEIIPSRGTYFQLLGYREISGDNDRMLAKQWTVEHKVASIPVSAFYRKETDHKVLRFCFAKSRETLLKGAEILCSL